MPSDLTLSTATLYSFLLVLARVGSALVFVPLPGLNSAPQPVRAAFALACTFALYARWPVVEAAHVTIGTLIAWVAAEAAMGIGIGVCVAIALEAFAFAAHMVSVPAGYSFASTIDPNTEADSTVLVVMAQLIAGMLFFAMGLDREILRLFAMSLDKVPVGAYIPGRPAADTLIHLGSNLFSVGVRIALPVAALLIMVDVAVALLGRLNAQLHLMSMTFPAKMLVALLMLGWIASVFPRMLLESSGHAWVAARQMLGI
jgi:flagellar biosynthetic protein FliR